MNPYSGGTVIGYLLVVLAFLIVSRILAKRLRRK